MKPLLLLPAAAIAAGCTEKAEPPVKPNVIVILADDLGFGDVGAYGQTTISTPNIDRLAHGGVSLVNGYATSATSTPSRYALMTGMYPWKNDRAKILPGDAPLIVSTGQYTLPRMMQQNGYRTGAIGKWHLGMGVGEIDWNGTITPGANEVGFDYSCLIAATVDRVPTVYIENGQVVGLDPNDPIEVNYEHNFEGEPDAISNPEMIRMEWSHGHNNAVVNGIPRIGYMKGGQAARWIDEDMADYFTGKVKDFIAENSGKPFFLYYGLHQPHVPRTPHPRFASATTMGPRGDAIIEADWCVGEVISTLEEQGLLDNTILIFTSDNGPVLNDGYKDGAAEMVGDHDPRGGLRGGKYSLFDAGTHVPFFVYWKGNITPVVSGALVSQMDLAASLGALTGGEVPEGLDSENLIEAFMGKSTSGRRDLILEAQGKLAMREGDFALIPPYRGPEMNLTGNELGNLPYWGLFDVASDPGQRVDISAAQPDRLGEMKEKFLSLTAGYYTDDVKEVPLK